MADTIRLSETPKAVLITLNGRISAQNDDSLSKALEKLKELPGDVKAIDLTSVDFIDSYALGQILFFCSTIRNEGKKAVIVNTSSNDTSYVYKLIEVAELSQVVEIVSDITAIDGTSSNRS